MRQLGGTVGLALMGSFVTSRFSANVRADLPAAVRRALGPATGRLDNPQVLISRSAQVSLQHALRPFGSQGVVLYEQLRQAIRLALAASLHDVFIVEVLVAMLPVAVVLFLKEIPLRGASPRQDAAEDGGVMSGRSAAGN
jgi:hypothetical protein